MLASNVPSGVNRMAANITRVLQAGIGRGGEIVIGPRLGMIAKEIPDDP